MPQITLSRSHRFWLGWHWARLVLGILKLPMMCICTKVKNHSITQLLRTFANYVLKVVQTQRVKLSPNSFSYLTALYACTKPINKTYMPFLLFLVPFPIRLTSSDSSSFQALFKYIQSLLFQFGPDFTCSLFLAL